MAEPPDTIFEEREELMISPTGDGKPVLRTAHFLKPTVTSIDGPVLKLRSFSLSSAYTTSFEVGEWPLNVYFNGRRCQQKSWKSWVDRLRSRYESTWKQTGIYEAILNSTYKITRNDDLVLAIAERWCPRTKTFIFPWGEATITLEDMMALGGYSVLGQSVLSHLQTEEMVIIEECLIEARKEAGRSAFKSANQDVWIKLCYGCGTDFEHEAFLALWLSRFVFPDGSNLVKKRVFPIAILLAKGIRIALAPAVLASIYRDLRVLKETIVASTKLDLKDGNDEVLALTLRAPFQLVQIWVWERFVGLRPKPNLTEFGEPRWARWDKMKKIRTNDLRLVLDSAGDCFRWRPYITALNSGGDHYWYSDKEKSMMLDPVLDGELQSFARCVRVSELVGLDCIQQYLPHRVAMQFGIDQDLPGCVARCNESPEIAWSNYSRPISDVKLCIPSRLFESDVTTRYMEWWKQLLFGLQDAIKGVVRQRRSPRRLKTLKRILESSEGVKGDMSAYVPPGFHSYRKSMEARICSNKYGVSTRMDGENEQHLGYVDFKDVPPPPGFQPEFKRVKAEKSCYEHNDFQGLAVSIPPPPGFPPKFEKVKAEKYCYDLNDFQGLVVSDAPGFPPKFNGVDGMISSTKCSSLDNRQDGESHHLRMADSQWLSSPIVDIKNVPPPPGFPPKFNGVEGMISCTRCSSLETKPASVAEKLQATQSRSLSVLTADDNSPSIQPGLPRKCNSNESIGTKLVDQSKPLLSTQSPYLCDEAVSKMESLVDPVVKVIMHGEVVIRGFKEAVEDGNASGAAISAHNVARTNDQVSKSNCHCTLDLESRISKLERVVAALKSAKK